MLSGGCFGAQQIARERNRRSHLHFTVADRNALVGSVKVFAGFVCGPCKFARRLRLCTLPIQTEINVRSREEYSYQSGGIRCAREVLVDQI